MSERARWESFPSTRRMRIVVELEVIETAPNSVCEISLLISIAANGLADCKGLVAGRSQVNSADQAVEPAR